MMLGLSAAKLTPQQATQRASITQGLTRIGAHDTALARNLRTRRSLPECTMNG